MRIVITTLLALILIWAIIFDLKLNKNEEIILDFTDKFIEKVLISDKDNIEISVYYFEKCDLETLDYIFANIELKKSMGNKINLILFKNEQDSLVLADPYIEKRLGELKMDSIEKILSEGIKSNNETESINTIIFGLEKDLKGVSKTALKIDYVLRRLPLSGFNVDKALDFAEPLNVISDSLK